MTKAEAIVKMQRYCDYQDRCHQEVRYKLISIKVYGDLLEEVMSELIQEGYLSDERYARSYARGKYRIKKWGKLRIQRELKSRQISSYCIKKAMEEIDEEGGYVETLEALLEKFIDSKSTKYEGYVLRKKAFQHATVKGYEYGLINNALDKLSI